MSEIVQPEAVVISKKDVCAIFVTYFPDDDFFARLSAVQSQVSRIIIVDNSASDQVAVRLQQLCAQSIVLLENNANLGLAAGLNRGVSSAREAGYAWAFLLDQDTTAKPGAVDQLLAIVNMQPQMHRVAAVGSRYHTPRTAGGLWTEETSIITSGTLLSIQAFEKIGPFREDFFVDCVDLEYSLRARSAGFMILQSGSKLIDHQIGNTSSHQVLGFRVGTSNHPPQRRYSMGRNLAILFREYSSREPGWLLRMFYVQLKSFLLLCFFESSRWQKVKAYLSGVVDGLKTKRIPGSANTAQ